MTVNGKQVVFIMATGHSGSTLLDLLLGSHSRIFSLGELNLFDRRFGKSFGVSNHFCVICDDECEYWNRRASLWVLRRYFTLGSRFWSVVRRISQHHRSIYQYLFEWFDSDVLVDSSKSIFWIRRQLRPAYHWKQMSPVLLYLTRDGRAILSARLRRFRERGVDELAKKWKAEVQEMEAYYREFAGKKMQVAYERLATNPEQVMRELCGLLEVEFEPAMLTYWIHDHHLLGGNPGTHSLILKYRSQFGHAAPQERPIVDREYYEKIGLAIKLDLRWKEELTEEQLAVFEALAGKANEPYAYDG